MKKKTQNPQIKNIKEIKLGKGNKFLILIQIKKK